MPRTKKEITNENVNEEVDEVVTEKKDDTQLTELLAKMEEMAKMIENVNKENKELKEQIKAPTPVMMMSNEKNLPKKVKVMSLLPCMMNLIPRNGRPYAFEGIGDVKIINLNDIQDILSDSKFREQAEKGYFVILNKELVEDEGLDDFTDANMTKQDVEDIISLKAKDVVEKISSFDENKRRMLCVTIAQNIANNDLTYDRNITYAIMRNTGIDIEKYVSIFQTQNAAYESMR